MVKKNFKNTEISDNLGISVELCHCILNGYILKVWFQNARAKQRKVCQESESVAESEVSKVNVNETSRIELLKIDWLELKIQIL